MLGVIGRGENEDGRLSALGSFADDPQRVLAAIFWLAGVGCERLKYFLVCTVKRRAATFADRQQRITSDNAHFPGTHEHSLQPSACANEMAPVPKIVE
jgi:hypothetical protein